MNSIKTTKVSIIGTVGLPAKYGGFETLTEHLVSNLNDQYSFSVYCSSKAYSKKLKTYKNARLLYIPFKANGKSSIIYDVISIIHSIFRSDILLVLGVSGAVALPFVKLFTSKRIIVNIDGLEWKREKWNRLAKFYLKWQEKIAVKYADKIIADNFGIKEYVKEEYNIDSELIAYGGDHANKISLDEKVVKEYELPSQYAFTVCRIEPENNIHIILKSFSLIKDYSLIVVGNWEANDYGKHLITKYQKFGNIKMLNPIYDQQKLDILRSNSKIYIHGHSAGGTNPSLVEAMWLELPIFCWDVNYNRYTTENSCKYFNNYKELIHLVKETNDTELLKIKNNLKSIADKKYNWKSVSSLYDSLL